MASVDLECVLEITDAAQRGELGEKGSQLLFEDGAEETHPSVPHGDVDRSWMAHDAAETRANLVVKHLVRDFMGQETGGCPGEKTFGSVAQVPEGSPCHRAPTTADRKSTRLNSSHLG